MFLTDRLLFSFRNGGEFTNTALKLPSKRYSVFAGTKTTSPALATISSLTIISPSITKYARSLVVSVVST